jgi:hypothetical protein
MRGAAARRGRLLASHGSYADLASRAARAAISETARRMDYGCLPVATPSTWIDSVLMFVA